jgi:pimeloyl-ACP methyl ester carboxylesterase
MLHGFPEFSYGWRHQIPALVEAGYRVWAPDQRGYNLSDKPKGIAAYNLDVLAADVVGLIDAAGSEKALLIGHDWGGLVAWQVAARYPDRLAKLVVLNAPNTATGQRRRISLAQLRKSWYILFFQLPWLPEYLMRQNNWQLVVDSLTGSSRPAAFSGKELERYRQAWSQPDAFRAMLNWYRALLREPTRRPAGRRIDVPTLLIWGAKDHFLGRELAQPSIDRCAEGRLVFIEEATHWVQHEEPERVNALILDHFQPTSAS